MLSYENNYEFHTEMFPGFINFSVSLLNLGFESSDTNPGCSYWWWTLWNRNLFWTWRITITRNVTNVQVYQMPNKGSGLNGMCKNKLFAHSSLHDSWYISFFPLFLDIFKKFVPISTHTEVHSLAVIYFYSKTCPLLRFAAKRFFLKLLFI